MDLAGIANYNQLMNISDDDSWLKHFEKKLRTVDRLAISRNLIHSLNDFLSNFGIVVAALIILVTIISTSNIQPHCNSVVVLTLLEIIRRYLSCFFAFFVLQKITVATTDPRFLTYSDSTRQTLISLSRKVNWVVQISLLAVSMVLSTNGLCAEINPKLASEADLLVRIFYKASLTNAILVVLAIAFLDCLLFPRLVTSPGLRKYYDTRIWMEMQKGFLHACSDDVDFLSFCFDLQAEEYRRNQRAPVVMELYGDLMRYLYCDARFKGFEKASQLLESGNPYQREAAANIVGCWLRQMEQNRSSRWKTLMVQQRLLSKLADALDHEETGRAATSSFEALAKMDAKFTAMVKNQKGENLADILMDRIHEVVEMGKSDKAIVFIKVWIKLLPVVLNLDSTENTYPKSISEGAASWWKAVTENINDQFVSKYCTINKLRLLQQDLVKIVSDSGALKRTQAVAAYALLISDDPLLDSILPSLKENLLTTPRRTEHILTEERDYALFVLNHNYVSSGSYKLYGAGDAELPVQWNGKVKHRSVSGLQKAANKSSWFRVRVSPYVTSLITIAVPMIQISTACFATLQNPQKL